MSLVVRVRIVTPTVDATKAIKLADTLTVAEVIQDLRYRLWSLHINPVVMKLSICSWNYDTRNLLAITPTSTYKAFTVHCQITTRTISFPPKILQTLIPFPVRERAGLTPAEADDYVLAAPDNKIFAVTDKFQQYTPQLLECIHFKPRPRYLTVRTSRPALLSLEFTW